jgi:hypothetical protein
MSGETSSGAPESVLPQDNGSHHDQARGRHPPAAPDPGTGMQHAGEEAAPLVSGSRRWRHSGMAQTILLGTIFFCVPGMWNAITSMAGGLDDARVASQATAWLYSTYAVSSFLAPIPCSVYGPRRTLMAGTIGYSLYVASLLLYKVDAGGAALVISAGALNGVCAGLAWIANGVLMYTYAGREGRGKLEFLFMAYLGNRNLTLNRLGTSRYEVLPSMVGGTVAIHTK